MFGGECHEAYFHPTSSTWPFDRCNFAGSGRPYTDIHPGVTWDNTHIQVAWTQGWPDGEYSARVRDATGHDTTCYTGTQYNSDGSIRCYGRWYWGQQTPHLDRTAEVTIDDYDFFGAAACSLANHGDHNRVVFHWQNIPDGEGALGQGGPCMFQQIIREPCPEPVPTMGQRAGSSTPTQSTQQECPSGVRRWLQGGEVLIDSSRNYYTGTGFPLPSGVNYDFWSIAAHEIGHIFNLNHYPPEDPDVIGSPSLDFVCNHGASDFDGSQDSLRETMCVPYYQRTARQRTPERHEKDTINNLY